MRNARLCTLVVVAGMVAAGCGQKGPLVLPDATKHKKVAPATRAPAGTTEGTVPTSPPPTDAAGSPPDAPQSH